MKMIHISWGGPDRTIKDSDGKVWTFEDHPRFGPIILNARGAMADPQPGSRSVFWPAWEAWRDGGKIVDAAGACQWTPKPEPELVHLGSRNYALARSKLAQMKTRGHT